MYKNSMDNAYSFLLAIGTKTMDCLMSNGHRFFIVILPFWRDSFCSLCHSSKFTGKAKWNVYKISKIISKIWKFSLCHRMARLQLKKLDSSFLGLFVDTVLGFLCCVMTFGAAIMITLGFITWCSQMTLRFPSYVHSSRSISQAHKFDRFYWIENHSIVFIFS